MAGLGLALLASGAGGTLLGTRLGFTLPTPALPPAIGAARQSPLRYL